MTKYYKTKREELFFEPQIRDLQTINNNQLVIIPEFKAIMNGKDCLGVRPKPADAEECQYYEHEFAYEAARQIAEEIDPTINTSWAYKTESGSETLVFLGYFDNSKIYFHDTVDEKLKETSETLEFDYVEKYHPEDNRFTMQTISEEKTPEEDLYDLLCFGFKPTIAVKNEYTYGGRTIFYLLVEPDDNENNHRTYLTISKFTFSDKTVENMQTSDRAAVEYLGNRAALHKCVPHFQKAIKDFVNAFDSLQEIEANPQELTAVALDIFNKNRSAQAMLSDAQLQSDIFKFIDRALTFFQGQDNMSELIHFMVRYNYFDFSQQEVLDKEYKDILTQKRAYGNLKRLFTGKNEREEQRHKYVVEQLNTYQELTSLFPTQIHPLDYLRK
jgi:hypothetical protein